MRRPIKGFWETDRSLTYLLSFLVLVIFILFPLGDVGVVGHFLLGLFLSAALVSGVLTVIRSRTVALIAGTLVTGSVVAHWIHIATAQPTWLWLDLVLSMLSIALLALVVLAQVFREGPITMQRVQGAIVVYLLLGLVWSFAYRLIEFHDPNAFVFSNPRPLDIVDIGAPLTYFSFTTLTTVGYGDITAVNALARSLAMLEALVGQLYLAILIARLVSLEVHHRQTRQSSKE